MTRLLTVIGSVRPGRAGLPIGEWFHAHARDHGGFETELVDLAVLDLPLLDEPAHPRLREYTQEHTFAWSAIAERADAVVFVTSEYNYGYPSALKNAIDYLHHEWRHKAVGFVSYGGVAAGTRAVQQLRQVTGALGMYSTQAAVNIPFFTQFLVEGRVEPNQAMLDGADAMLEELRVLDGALRTLRGG